jgi:hypothetical protein
VALRKPAGNGFFVLSPLSTALLCAGSDFRAGAAAMDARRRFD